jgi:hypothetical protein
MHHLIEKIIRKLKSILIKLVPYNTGYKPEGFYNTVHDYVSSNKHTVPPAEYVEVYAGYDSELGVPDNFYEACPPYTRQPLQVYVPPSRIVKMVNSRLLTDTITNLSIITHDNKLLHEVSYQWGKHQASDNAVFQQKFFIHPKKYKGTAFHMLVGGAGLNNYFHWLFDVLPRLHLLEKSRWYDQTDFFIVPSYKRTYQKESLQLLGIDKSKIIEGDKETHLQADILIATTHVRYRSYIPVWACKFLKSHFPPTTVPDADNTHRIYISRRDASFRYIVNEDAVIAVLKKFNFQIVQTTGMSFQEQVNLFASADFIIATHGAGMANLAFCKKGTTVLELFSQDFVVPLYYDLANKVRLHYAYLVCQPDVPAGSVAQGIRQNLMVDLNELEAKVTSLLRMPDSSVYN